MVWVFSLVGIQSLTDKIAQSTKTGDGALIVQSGHDTNIGFTSKQMAEIIDAISSQLPAYAAIAREMVDMRLEDFKKAVLNKFLDDKNANKEAFGDPDFQYLMGRAQHTYARSGEENVKHMLAELIAQRSLQSERNRLALTLNSAVEKAAVLTKEEFSALSLCFLLKYTVRLTILSHADLIVYLKDKILPFVEDAPKELSSFMYLESEGCASISLGNKKMGQVLKMSYLGLFSKGFNESDLISILPENECDFFAKNPSFLAKCINDDTKLQLNFLREKDFNLNFDEAGISSDTKEKIWKLFLKTIMNESEIIDLIKQDFPEILMIQKAWDDSALSKLQLTTTGIAIAHANAQRIIGFETNLSVWIR